jgi:hypothetical protein
MALLDRAIRNSPHHTCPDLDQDPPGPDEVWLQSQEKSMIHQSLMIPFSPASLGGGIGYPKAGKLQLPKGTIMLDRVSATPAGIMLHILVDMPPAASNLVLPAGVAVAGVKTAPYSFAIVQDGEERPSDASAGAIYLGSVAVPPGLGLHVYAWEGEEANDE